MTDPYDASNTLAPGEVAQDDPMDDTPYCPRCDAEVEVIGGDCIRCGEKIE